jgi:hypothetical protein
MKKSIIILVIVSVTISISLLLSCATNYSGYSKKYYGITSSGDLIEAYLSSSSFRFINKTKSTFINGTLFKNNSDDIDTILSLHKGTRTYFGIEKYLQMFSTNYQLSDNTTQLSISISGNPIDHDNIPGDYFWFHISDQTTSSCNWGILQITENMFYRKDFYLGIGGDGTYKLPENILEMDWETITSSNSVEGIWSVNSEKDNMILFNQNEAFALKNDLIIIKTSKWDGFIVAMRINGNDVTQQSLKGNYIYINEWYDETGEPVDYGAGNFSISSESAAFYHQSYDSSKDTIFGSMSNFTSLNYLNGSVKWSANKPLGWSGTLYMSVSPLQNCMYVLLIDNRVRSIGVGGILE